MGINTQLDVAKITYKPGRAPWDKMGKKEIKASMKAAKGAMPQQFVDLGLVDTKDIAVNPDNQNVFNDGHFVRLKSEISNNGFIDKKIIIRALPKGGDTKYMIIDGNHHFQAAKELGYQKVPCLLYVANWTGVSS